MSHDEPQCCGNCKFSKRVGAGHIIRCEYPLPIWLMREIYNPLSGGGANVDVLEQSQGEHCRVYEVQR
jgi:hypothetical protein